MDEKGYVMSGIGFLLIIPIIIMIPIALSVENQSANIPNTFVKSDSIYYLSKNIQRDMSLKLGDFRDNIDNTTYIWNGTGPSQFTGSIITLFDKTNNTYNASNYGVDSVNITSKYTRTMPSFNSNSSGVINGSIPLSNGIMIYYELDDYNKSGNNYIYNYTVYPTINSTIKITKTDSGNIQNYLDQYLSADISINTATNDATTAATRTINFFNSTNSILGSYCYP